MTDPRLVALALKVADELDHPATGVRVAPLAGGIIRRLAREATTGPEPTGCPECGAPLGDDPRRRYCCTAHRQRAWRARHRDVTATHRDNGPRART